LTLSIRYHWQIEGRDPGTSEDEFRLKGSEKEKGQLLENGTNGGWLLLMKRTANEALDACQIL
jgi:hypothetical protein